MRRVVGWTFFCVPLVLLGSFVPVTRAGAAARPVDRDGNKIFDVLDRTLQRSADGDRVDVIVVFSGGDSRAKVREAQLDVGRFETTYEYATMAAVAASTTPGQVRALAARPDVVQVQPNSDVEFALDTARASAGVDKAVLDFAVDGNNESSLTCPGLRQYCKDDVVAAVLDSGIHSGHVDLDGGKVLGGVDCSTGSCTGSIWYDSNGHGTYVSSILAGEGDGDPSMRGVAPGAALVSVRVGSSGSTVSAVDAGLEWVLANRDVYGIDLVNMSLSGKTPSDGTDTTSRLTNRLAAAGVTPVAAAGNGAPDPGQVSFPAAAKFATAVGSMSEPGDGPEGSPAGYALWMMSNRGPTLDGRVKPDVVAYGVDITAADLSASTYKTSGGTSAASPFAAGVAALMLDANPTWRSSGTACATGDTSAECLDGVIDATMSVPLKDGLMSSAVDWAGPGLDNETGAGRVDAYAAVDSASLLTGTGGPQQPTHSFVEGTITSGSRLDHPIEVTSTRFPIAAAVIAVDRATGETTPDLNLSILDPSGAQIALSAIASNLRQETTGASPSVTGKYVIRVESVAGGGRYWLDISYGGSSATPTPTPTAPPGAPASLVAASVAGSTSQIDLSWGNVADESGYKVERSSDGISGWVQVGTTATDVTTYRDSGLTSSTTYYYRVRAHNAAGDSGYSNTASAKTNADTTAPTTPTNVKAASGRGKVSLTWTASTDSGGSGLAGYKVFRSTSSTGTYTQIGTTTTTAYTDTAVTKGKVYYYYVVAYDNAGNHSAASAKVSGKPT